MAGGNELLDGFRQLCAGPDLRNEVAENTRLNVESAKVMNFQRTDRREPETHAAAHGRIDVLGTRDTAVDEVPYLAHDRHLDSVHQETGQFPVDADRLL